MLLAQFYLLFGVLYSLGEYVGLYAGGSAFLLILMSIHVVNSRSNPTAKITWLVLLAIFPIAASLMYFYIDVDPGFRMTKKRLSEILGRTYKYLPENKSVYEEIEKIDPALFSLAQYMNRYGNAPIFKNSSCKYLPSGEAMFEELISELQKAEKFIFLEYFIISEGYMWGSVLKILKEKAEQGVDVKVLYDGTCAIKQLPYGYPLELSRLGIQCKMFSPILPLVSSHYNNRDHRKIVVIDGHTAFTGGANLSDEYMNVTHPYGHWKDACIMVKGEAVYSFSLMFLQMWNLSDKELNYSKYLDSVIPVPEDAEGYIIPYGDSPLDGELVGKNVYMDILNNATQYVHITTPYLIPDSEMASALCFAAKRGVDVKIIVPGVPDKKLIFMLSKSYYGELIDSGVEIFEYSPGFIHSKQFVSDGKSAVVGTINLDYRSLYLHFECGAYLRNMPVIGHIESDFLDTLQKCRKITRDSVARENKLAKLVGKLMRILAPLT